MRALLLAVLLSACSSADQAHDAPATLQPTESQPFVVGRNDATGLIGAHLAGSTVTRFESTSSDRVHESIVRIHEKTFTFRRDETKQEFTVNSNGASIDPLEKLALAELLTRVQRLWVEDDKLGPREPIPMHGAMLLGELLWLSGARPGMKVMHFVRAREPRILWRERDLRVGLGDRTFDYGTEPFFNKGLYCANQYDGRYIWASTQPWDGEKNLREEHLAIVNGTGGTETACDGGLMNKGDNGCGSWECQGQCGVGCQSWWRNGRFTDCFEHDVCTDFHPDSDCDRDKFYAASAFVDSFAMLCR